MEAFKLRLGFTFALERGKTYTVGRDRSCDIRFESKYVKPKQGSVIVEDWDPSKVDCRKSYETDASPTMSQS